MNMAWILVGSAVVIVLALAVRLASAGGNSGEAKMKIRDGAMVIDVRTPGEYGDGHYEGATNIPLQELGSRLAELKDKNKAIVVYCASGMRSAQAARLLTAAGFTDVTNAGGLGNLR
jgi:phage shock protein E